MAGAPGPTTPLLDSFNRANESPLAGPNWRSTHIDGTALNVQLLSNQIAAISSAYFEAVWAADFPSEQEVYFTVGAFSSGFDISLRARSLGSSSWTGYIWESGSSSQQLYRKDAAGSVAVGAAFGSTPAAGDRFLYRVYGATHEAWKLISGAWTLQASRQDGAYALPGKVAVAGWNGTGRFDDIGGGRFGGSIRRVRNRGARR